MARHVARACADHPHQHGEFSFRWGWAGVPAQACCVFEYYVNFKRFPNLRSNINSVTGPGVFRERLVNEIWLPKRRRGRPAHACLVFSSTAFALTSRVDAL